MKRRLWFGLIAVLGMALAACSSAPIDTLYTASGDATQPGDLTRTTTFKPDDDLNLVITLGSHNRTLPIYATFTDPTGASYTTDPVEAGSAAGQVVLGLDYETQGITAWSPGEWQAAVFVDDDQEKTVSFTVEPSAAQPDSAG